MIYLFTGDPAASRAKAIAFLRATRAKSPESPYLRLDPEATTPQSLADAAGARGLFHEKSLVFVNDPFSLAASGEALVEAVPLLAASENAIYVLAPKLLKAGEPLRDAAAKVFDEPARAAKAERGFNAPLVDALGARNGAALWKEIAKAQRHGDAAESLHGLLHWKARDMMKKGGRAWSRGEARELSLSLLALLSESRSGNGLPLSLSLEHFALSMLTAR